MYKNMASLLFLLSLPLSLMGKQEPFFMEINIAHIRLASGTWSVRALIAKGIEDGPIRSITIEPTTNCKSLAINQDLCSEIKKNFAAFNQERNQLQISNPFFRQTARYNLHTRTFSLKQESEENEKKNIYAPSEKLHAQFENLYKKFGDKPVFLLTSHRFGNLQ